MKKVLLSAHYNILSHFESTACLWSSSPKPKSQELGQDLTERERGGGSSPFGVGVVGYIQCVYCSSLTYLHAADFHCLPTLLTITKRLCTLAAAQHSYTYCGPLSKETCTTSPGVLPKRPQPQFLLWDLSQHCSTIWALSTPSCFVSPSLTPSPSLSPASLHSHSLSSNPPAWTCTC